MSLCCVTGKAVYVDLTRKLVEKRVIEEEVLENFLGGRGLNARVLFDEIPSGIDPLGPENVLCMAAGLFSGTAMGLSGRMHVSTLSAYSGIMGDGNVGGAFAARMRRAGYDQVVIKGVAEKPSYILMEDDRVEILDASDLWGLSVWEVTDLLLDRHGDKCSVACIGQAGENLVRPASTMVDKYASAARGSGAVWGSKNLKAVVVRGTGKLTLADKEKFIDLTREDKKFLSEDKVQKDVASVYGSHFGVENWYPGYRNSEKNLAPEEVPDALRPEAWKKYETGRAGCQSCHIKCKNIYRIPEGPRKGELGEALEYECIYCLGTNCGIEDPVKIMEMENLSDIYGMDVVALGNTVAFAKDLYNRGIITDKDTGGLSLEWEDADAQVELIHKTAMREGFGNLIAEGMYSMARIIGKNAMDYCYHVKGLSRGVYPAGLFALAHAVATRGADHLRGRSWAAADNSEEDVLSMLQDKKIIGEDVVRDLVVAERATTMADTIGRCKGAVNTWTCAVPLIWKSPVWDGLAHMITAATGLAMTPEKVELIADRINILERMFNIKQGIRAEDDRIPLRPDERDTPEGQEQIREHFRLVKEYYRVHGFDVETGIPLRKTLEKLNLGFAADEVEAHGEYDCWDGPKLWKLEEYPVGTRRS